MESKFNFNQLITDYTRQTQTTKANMDWIYTDCPHVVEAGTLNINLSDHLAIFLFWKKHRNEIEKHTTKGRSYNYLNMKLKSVVSYSVNKTGHLMINQKM